MGRRFTTAAVLKAIRDREATTQGELDSAFGTDHCRKIAKIIEDLVSVGLVLFKDGRLEVSDQWTRIQGLLEISLTSLDESLRPGVISVQPLFGIPDATAIADVFVLMSFDPDFKPIYATHISRVAKKLRLTVGRADDFFTAHSVMVDVWTAVYRSRVVIADCTGRNPNVFYEIGMAHTAGKPVILITRDEADVPFDLRHLRHITYAYTPPGMDAFEDALERTLQDVLKK